MKYWPKGSVIQSYEDHIKSRRKVETKGKKDLFSP